MGVGSGLYLYDVVVKRSRSRSLSHVLMSSCLKYGAGGIPMKCDICCFTAMTLSPLYLFVDWHNNVVLFVNWKV